MLPQITDFYASVTVRTMLEALCVQVVHVSCLCLHASQKFVKTMSCKLLLRTFENFAKFTSLVHWGTKMNLLHFEVKRSKAKVMHDQNQ